MRVLFTTCPAADTVRPVVPLAWAVRSAGHEVWVGCLPDLCDEVTAAGLPALVATRPGTPVAMVGGSPGELSSRPGQQAALLVDGLLGVLRAHPPDLVVHEPMDFAGPLLGALLGVPALLHSPGPPLDVPTVRLMRRAGAALRQRYGLFGRGATPDLVLDGWPAGLRTDPAPGPGAADNPGRAEEAEPRHQAMRHVPFGGGRVPDWVTQPAAGSRVCVLPRRGTSAGAPEAAMLAGLGALAERGIEVVALPAGKDGPEPHPDRWPGVRPVPWTAPHHVSAGCAAAVHHGDPDTVLTFLAAGVPQVVLPLSPDELRCSIALEAAGAGRSLAPDSDAQQIAAAVYAAVRDEQQRRAALGLAAQLRAMPSPHAVVPRLVRLASAGRGPATADATAQ